MNLYLVGKIKSEKEWQQFSVMGIFDSEEKAIKGCYENIDCFIALLELNTTYPDNNKKDLENIVVIEGSYYPFREQEKQGSLPK